MRLPKTFIPEKDLETKIKKLLEKPVPKTKRRNHVYHELKKEFPQFIDYLLKLYPDLWILKTRNNASYSWYFYTSYTKQQSPRTEIGSATVYIKEAGKNLLEYGNEAEIRIQGKWYNLKYRRGYYIMDNQKKEIAEETRDPYRYDSIKDIPFP